MKNLKRRIKKTKLGIYYNELIRIYYSRKYNIPRNDILQLANTTKYNRHEDLFSLAQNSLGKEKKIRILSFGCSSGEECFSLGEYFPNAIIVGCDINKDVLDVAKMRNKNSRIEFVLSNNSNLLKYKYFDLVLANSVLIKQPMPGATDNISKLFPFNQFNEIIETLDNLINTNGLFIMRDANYRFEDTSVAFKYKCLLHNDSSFPIYDRNGNSLKGINRICQVFKKCDIDSEKLA